MRVDEVPQQNNATLDGEHKAVYALDERGRMQVVASSGWEAEEMVTTDAVAWFEARAAEALARARCGETSALEYQMYRQRMDLPTLAQVTGLWQWRIRRHLRTPFARLPPHVQKRYAAALGLAVAQVDQLGDEHILPISGLR